MANQVERFRQPRENFEELRERAIIATDQSLQTGTLDPNIFTAQLLKLFAKTQNENQRWIEGRFQILRRELGHWSYDGIMISREGRIILGPWSTYLMYLQNQPVDLTMDSLQKLAIMEKDLVIPLVPQKDSTLFWLLEHEDPVLSVLRNHIHSEVEDYPDVLPREIGFVAMAKRRRVRMTRVERGKIGDKRFAEGGVVRGTLGFWQNSTAEGLTYSPRVQIEKSTGIEKTTFISPIPESVLLTRGSLPMNENHPNVDIIRTDPQIARHDFIVAALSASAKEFGGKKAFVLRYDTYRPWQSFLPHHGGNV